MTFYYLKIYTRKNLMNTDLVTNKKSTRRLMIESDSEWFESKRDEWDLFTLTAVFRASGWKPNPDRWIEEYKHKVLWKINKQLTRGNNYLIPFDRCEYEFDQSSLFKSLSEQRKPHHIHGIVSIPKDLSHKVWNLEKNILSPRLLKDFNSIDTVSSVLMEPIPVGRTLDWYVYMMKGKSFNSH